MKGLADALAENGLTCRGGIIFGESDEAPPGPSGTPARGMILVGHGGGTIWPHFTAWLNAREDEPR
jgi:hypothetical protein